MTNREFLSDSNFLDELAEMSFYEDALDLSESELQQLCNETARHLRFSQQSQLRFVSIVKVQDIIAVLFSNLSFDSQIVARHSNAAEPVASPKPGKIQSSSSGDNSSIERISYGRRSNMSESQNNGQSTSRTRQRRRGAQRSNASSNGESWKAVNAAVSISFHSFILINT